jgi:hypothetical protein
MRAALKVGEADLGAEAESSGGKLTGGSLEVGVT